jgi:hypothetical protein
MDFDWAQLVVNGKMISAVAFRMPFAQGVAAPISNRNGGDVHTYLDISRLLEAVEQQWPKDLPSPTPERLLATVLADGSFTFDGKERRRCRNGISESHIQNLLHMYSRLGDSVSDEDADLKKTAVLRNHARIAWDRVLIVDDHWRLGLAHASVREEDSICILHGSKVPIVLRRFDNGNYRLMGQCYLEGVMRCEAITRGKAAVDTFVLV